MPRLNHQEDHVRQRLFGLLSVVTAFVVLSSCGGSNGPTGPTITSIMINSTSAFLMLGQTETFTATINFSNGTTQALTGGTWGSDATTVATVGAATGLVTTVRSGDVTIFVDAQGARGSKKITVVPNYAGIWAGSYVVNACTQTLGFITANLCGTTFTIGATLPVAFNLTQTGGTVSGQTAIGSIPSNQLSTTAVAGGGLVFQATAFFQTVRIDQAWQLNQANAGQLTGSAVQTWTEPSTTGQMVVTTTLIGATKSTAMPLAMRGENPLASWSSVAEALRRVR
jgi:hypothetical protein